MKISEVYENLIEGAPDSIVAMDRKGNITYCNKAAEILTGYAKEELIGRHFSRVGWIKNKDISHYLKLFKELLKGKKVAPFEMEARCKDRKSYWVEVHVSRIKTKGKVSGFQVSVRDITERRQVEESWKQKVLELNSFIDNIPDMAWLKDDKSRFIALNKAFGEVVGMKPETLIGQTCEVCFGAKAGKKFREDDLKVMKGRRQVSIEEKILDSKGKKLWLESVKSPIFGKSGKIVGTVGIARNVTERKRAEEMLKESEQRFKAIFDNATDGILMVDPETRKYLTGNRMICQMLGYSLEEIKNLRVADIHPKESLSDDLRKFEKVLKREIVLSENVPVKRKDGSIFYADINTFLIELGGKTYLMGIFRDITQRKRAEEALIRNERVASERARLLTDLRNLDRIDDILTRVCEAVRDSGLFERAVMTLHKPKGQIVHLGQVGLPPDVVKRARQASPMDQNLRARVTSKKFRISDSFFIPAEAGLDYTKTGRHIPQKKRKLGGGDWQPADELFVPLCDFSGKIMGYLSVDTPTDSSRPDVKTIQALEMLVEAAAARVRELEAHEALKRERDFSQSILETANSLIVCLDADAKIMVFNQECERVTGYRREEVLGKRWPELFLPPDHHHFKLKSFAKWVRAHPRDQYEGPIVTKSGEIRTILWSNTAILGSGKKDVVAIALGHDITERKRVEEALRESEKRFRTISTTAKDAILMMDNEGNISYWNPAAEEIFGYLSQEVIGKELHILLAPKRYHEAYRKEFSAFKETGQGVAVGKTLELEAIRKDGTEFPIELSLSAIKIRDRWHAVGILRDITERKRAEEALQISQERYELSTKAANVGVWDWDIKTNKFYIDPNVKEILGYKDEEIPNDIEVWMTYVHPDDREPVMAAAQACLDGKTPEYVFEHRMVHKDGSVRWILSRGNVIRDAKGNAVRMVGTDTDITERKRTEEALQESEQRFRSLVETTSDWVWEVDQNGIYTYASPKVRDLLGYEPEEVIGKTPFDFMPPDEAERVAGLFKDIVKSRKPFAGLENTNLHKDGRHVVLETSGVPILDAGGNLLGYRGIDRDMTERKRVEDALKQSEKKYRTLVETAQEGIGITDPKENLTFVNQAFANMLGYKKEELLGKNLSQISDEEEFAKFRKEAEKRKRGKSSKYEATLFTKRGKPKYFYVSAVPIRAEDGSFQGTLGVLTDITELKRAREQNLLLETSKALSGTLKLHQVLKIATKKMAQALKADRCAVAFTDQNIQSVTVKHIYLEDGSPSSAHLDVTVPTRHFSEAKESLKTKGYYQISNTRTDPIPKSLRKYFLRAGVKSCLVIPMSIGERLLGLFSIGSVKELRNFTEEEIRLAQTIANQVAVAVENSLLLKDVKGKHDQIAKQTKVLERQYREQAMLMKISRELSKTLDSDRILQIATKEAAQALKVDRCTTFLVSPEEGYSTIRSIYVKEGESVTHLLKQKYYPLNYPQGGKMLEKKKSITIPNIYHLPDKDPVKEHCLKEGIKSLLVSPMVHGKKLVGFFVLSTTKDFKTFAREETKLAQTIADQVAVAIENARLLELVRKSSEDLKTLSAQLINVQEDERKRIAQELHDEIGQTLFAMKMNLDVTTKNLPPDIEKLEDIKSRLSDTEDLLSQTIDQIRNLTTDLRPSMLDDFGLIPALKWYIDNFSKRTNIKVYLKTKNFKPRLSSEVETTFYRILQEALTNVAKHAKATQVSILLARDNSAASLSVEDNGIGFDAKKATFPKDRLGLFSIKERVKLLNGEFKIGSKPNRGTKLSVRIPLTERRV